MQVLTIASGCGRKPTYGSNVGARVLQEVQQAPDRDLDTMSTWSLGSLQKALRQSELPQIGATTFSRMLHEEDYPFNLKRTRQDSNPQPLDPKSSALSIELLVHYRNSTI